MENLPIDQYPQSSQQVNSSHLEQSSSPKQMMSLLLPVLMTFLLSAIVFGLSGYYIGNKSQQLSPTKQLSPTPTNERNDGVVITPSPLAIAKQMSFSEVLSQFCLNSKINLETLPFALNQRVKDSYNIQDSIGCFVPDENYAFLSIRVENSDFSGNIRNVYFFHQNSKYMGMGDTFQSLSNYKTVSINGQNFWLNVREPGPYGISTLGVWIDLIGEKMDESSGTIVRVMNLTILKDEQFIALVKKYGTEITAPDGETMHIVNSSQQMQFIDEVVKLAPQNTDLKESAQNITLDLDGVSF